MSTPDVLLVMGVVLAALSIPLLLRAVPPNRFYGVRTRRAFASEQNWYALNAFGGKCLLGYGVFLIAAGAFERTLHISRYSVWQVALVLVPVLAVVPVLVLIGAYGRRLPP